MDSVTDLPFHYWDPTPSEDIFLAFHLLLSQCHRSSLRQRVRFLPSRCLVLHNSPMTAPPLGDDSRPGSDELPDVGDQAWLATSAK